MAGIAAVVIAAAAGVRVLASHVRTGGAEAPLEREMRRAMAAQGGLDAYTAHIRAMPRSTRGYAGAMALTRRGLARLSATDQEARLRLVLSRLRAVPVSQCGAVARGDASRKVIASVLGGMDSVSLAAFADIAARAALAEVRRSPPPQQSTTADMEEFLQFVLTRATPADAERFVRVIERLPKVGDDDACWVIFRLYGAALEAPAPRRGRFIRVITTLESQQPTF